jgi:predicted amidohydrolase
MRAHLVQLDIAWEDPARNFERVADLLDRVEVGRNDLVLLPEMFDSGFSLNIERTADAGATLAFLTNLATDLGVYVQGGRTVRAGAKATNRAPAIGPDGSVLADYAKIHPFSFGNEPERFDAGGEVVTYRWADGGSGLSVCPAVCYDLRFPELFRIGLRRGAEVFALGANWPSSRQHHWRALLIARAIENQAYVLGVNRTGTDPNLVYAGGSLAVGPRGEIVGELGAEEAVLSVEVQPQAIRAWRETFPAWKDIRLIHEGGTGLLL